jgi:purine nucleosidase
MPRKIILDIDTGVDDALALLLALRSPELELVGVTCVAGNTTIDNVVRNTLTTLEVAGSTVPVAVGARKPLMNPLRTATLFHGGNGLADLKLPEPRGRPVDEEASSFLTRHVREMPGEITVVAVGPLTNIALAVLADKEFASNAESLILMGGAVAHPGNATPAAEANFSNDPEAAAAVFESGARLYLVDLGATNQAVLPRETVNMVSTDGLSAVANFALTLLQFYGAEARSASFGGAVLHDPLAVALAALPDLASFVPICLTVETGGKHTRGATVANFSGITARVDRVGDHWDAVALERLPANAAVARRIDVPRFLSMFLERLELA